MADVVREIKKRPGHRLVIFGSGETLAVPHALFRLHALKTGEIMDAAAYQERMRAEEQKYALEAAVRMLEMRDRSCQEVYGRLTGSGFTGPAAAAAVARLGELGYLDDAAYARQTARRLQKKYGGLRIRQELRRKGVEEALIGDALREADPEDQLAAAVNIARAAYSRKPGEPRAAFRRAYAALARRGFTPDIVRAALSQVSEGGIL